MGIDYLDLRFRVEKRLGVKFSGNDMDPAGPFNELTVAGVQDMIVLAYERNGAGAKPIWIHGQIECPGCGFALQAVPVPGFCRHCGAEVTLDQFIRAVVNQCAADTLCISPNKVRPESLLIQDLGMD